MSPKMVAVPITITVAPELEKTVRAVRESLRAVMQDLDELQSDLDFAYTVVRSLHNAIGKAQSEADGVPHEVRP